MARFPKKTLWYWFFLDDSSIIISLASRWRPRNRLLQEGKGLGIRKNVEEKGASFVTRKLGWRLISASSSWQIKTNREETGCKVEIIQLSVLEQKYVVEIIQLLVLGQICAVEIIQIIILLQKYSLELYKCAWRTTNVSWSIDMFYKYLVLLGISIC